jgi:hypothetical protein
MMYPFSMRMCGQRSQTTSKDPGCIRGISLIVFLWIRRIEYLVNNPAYERNSPGEKAGDVEDGLKFFHL